MEALAVYPGQALGPFWLGAPLYSILSSLRSNPDKYPQINVIHATEDLTYHPIIVLLESNGLRLHFDGGEQMLRLIEVIAWNKSPITYKGAQLGQGVLPFKQIYSKAFGPTYPGIYDENSGKYILSYPGVAFTFDVSKEDAAGKKPESIQKMLTAPKDPPGCSAMAVFHGHSWPEARADIFKLSKDLPDLRALAQSSEHADEIEVDEVIVKRDTAICTVKFLAHRNAFPEYDILIGNTTMQDIIIALGPPRERVFKQDSRLAIHNPRVRKHSAKSATDDGRGSTDLAFFNYFNLGLDICFDMSTKTPIVVKVIIHGNVPTSLSFQKYKRCRWVLSDAAHSEANFFDYKANYAGKSLPMMLDHTIESPSSSVEFVGDELDFSDLNEWGVTHLYGSPRCIFEVLKAGAVSSLTVF